MIYDLVIIGCGAVGSAAGYYASQTELDILMIDAHHPPHCFGSHHGRQHPFSLSHLSSDNYFPLLQRTQMLWRLLEAKSKEPLVDRCGALVIAPEGHQRLVQLTQSLARWQQEHVQLSAEQITQRWPEITIDKHLKGIFEPQSGLIYGDSVLKFWIEQARQQGAGQLFNCPVSAIIKQDQIYKITTADGEYMAKRVLVSAGAAVSQLLPQLPVHPLRKVCSWYQADGRYATTNKFPTLQVMLADGECYYGFPAEKDEIKIAKASGGQPLQSPNQQLGYSQVTGDGSECFPFLRQCLPGVGVCLYGQVLTQAQTQDGDLIIDTLSVDPDCLIITGLNEQGLALAPLLGEIATQFAQRKPLPPIVEPFRLQRLFHS